jgi:hypothetical protein
VESTISTKPLWKQLPKAARTCLALRLVEHLDLGTQEEAEGSEAVGSGVEEEVGSGAGGLEAEGSEKADKGVGVILHVMFHKLVWHIN